MYADNIIVTSPNQSTSFPTTTKVNFVSLSQQVDGLEPTLGGILGLGYSDNANNQNLLTSILPAGNRTFSLLVNGSNVYDITYGGFNQSFIRQGSASEGYGIHWFDLKGKNDSWTIPLQDARYGYMSFLRSSADKATIATGMKFIHIPQVDYLYL